MNDSPTRNTIPGAPAQHESCPLSAPYANRPPFNTYSRNFKDQEYGPSKNPRFRRRYTFLDDPKNKHVITREYHTATGSWNKVRRHSDPR